MPECVMMIVVNSCTIDWTKMEPFDRRKSSPHGTPLGYFANSNTDNNGTLKAQVFEK